MNVCGIKEHLFRAPLNKKIMVITSIVTLIFDIFSGGFFLRQHGTVGSKKSDTIYFLDIFLSSKS